jgi:uncharacterized protein YceK
MNKISLLLLIGLLSGCSSVTPNYDAKFGDAVREARSRQVINPTAGSVPDAVAGIDGKASRESILLYQGTFKEPPPATNIINIGGGIGAAGAGSK